MKSLILFLMFSSLAYAQVENPDDVHIDPGASSEGPQSQPTKNPSSQASTEPSSTDNVPVKTFNFFKELLFRFHTLDLGAAIKEMKRDGVTGRNFVASFSTEGAIYYASDDRVIGNEFKEKSRIRGYQLLPFKLRFESDGSVSINASVMAWKNVSNEHFDLDSVELIRFEYNNDLSRGIRTLRAHLVDLNAKIALFKSNNNKFQIFIRVGASPLSMSYTRIERTPNVLDNYYYNFEGMSLSAKYGIFFSYTTENDWELEGGVYSKHYWDIIDVEGEGNSLDRSRSQWELHPYLQVKKQVNQPTASVPVKIGAKLEGRFLLLDKLQGEVNKDLRDFGRGDLINADVFVNW